MDSEQRLNFDDSSDIDLRGGEVEEVDGGVGGRGRPHNFVWRLRAVELFDAIRQQFKVDFLHSK